MGQGPNDDVPTDTPNADASIDRHQAYDVLSNTRRRYVIHHLLTADGSVSLRELSRQLAAWENDVEQDDVTSKQRKRVYTALHQSHLPKLDDAGVVSYDADRSVIEPTERLSDLRAYMQAGSEGGALWSVYYVGIGLAMGSGALLARVGLVPLSSLSGYAWAGLTALLVVCVGLCHHYVSRQHDLGTDGPPPELR